MAAARMTESADSTRKWRMVVLMVSLPTDGLLKKSAAGLATRSPRRSTIAAVVEATDATAAEVQRVRYC
jgi:hypothetical protein